MIDNILTLKQIKKLGLLQNIITFEAERFADSMEIEMSNSTGKNVHIRLDIEQVRQLAEFTGGFVGMIDA